TSDRHIASRVPGPNSDLQRDSPAAKPFRLCGVLQSGTHALGITERCTLASNSPTVWCHCRYSHPSWAASPIRSDMIFVKDRRSMKNPYLILAFASLCWSGNHIVGRAIAGHFPPLTISTIRWFIPAIILWIAWRTRIEQDWLLIRRYWVVMLWLGATGGIL